MILLFIVGVVEFELQVGVDDEEDGLVVGVVLILLVLCFWVGMGFIFFVFNVLIVLQFLNLIV